MYNLSFECENKTSWLRINHKTFLFVNTIFGYLWCKGLVLNKENEQHSHKLLLTSSY